MGLSRPPVLGPARMPLSGWRLIVPGQVSPWAEGAAQAWPDARAGLGLYQAKKSGRGPSHGPQAGWPTIGHLPNFEQSLRQPDFSLEILAPHAISVLDPILPIFFIGFRFELFHRKWMMQ